MAKVSWSFLPIGYKSSTIEEQRVVCITSILQLSYPHAMARHTRSHTGESDSTGSSTEVDRTPQPTWCSAFKFGGNNEWSDGTRTDGAALDGLGISTPTTLDQQSLSPRSQSPCNMRSPHTYASGPSSASHSPTATRPGGHARRASRITVSTKGHSRGTSVSSSTSSGLLDAFPSQESLGRERRRPQRDSFVGLPYNKSSASDDAASFISSTASSATSSRRHSGVAGSLGGSSEGQHTQTFLPAISNHRKVRDESRRRSSRSSASDPRRRDSYTSLASSERHDPDAQQAAVEAPQVSFLDQRSKSLPGGPQPLRGGAGASAQPSQFTILLDSALRPSEVYPRRESAPLPTLLAQRHRDQPRNGGAQFEDDSPLLINSPHNRTAQCVDAPFSPAIDEHSNDPYAEINWGSFIESGYSMTFAPGAQSPYQATRAGSVDARAMPVGMERTSSNESAASILSDGRITSYFPARPASSIEAFVPASDHESSLPVSAYEDPRGPADRHASVDDQIANASSIPASNKHAWTDDELLDDESPEGSPASIGFSQSPPYKAAVDNDSDADAGWQTPPEKPIGRFEDMAEDAGPQPSVAMPKHRRALQMKLGLNIHKANRLSASSALRTLSPLTPPPTTPLPPIPERLQEVRRTRGASISFSPTHNSSSHFPDVDALHKHARRPSTGLKDSVRKQSSFTSSQRQSEADLFSEPSPIPEETSDATAIFPQAETYKGRASTSLGLVDNARLDEGGSQDLTATAPRPDLLRTCSDSMQSLPHTVASHVSSAPRRPLRNPSRPSSADTKASHSSRSSRSSGHSTRKLLKSSSEVLEHLLARSQAPAIANRNASLTKHSRQMGSDVAGATPPRPSLSLPSTSEPTPADRAAVLRRLRLMGEDVPSEPLSVAEKKKTKGSRSRSGSASSVPERASTSTGPAHRMKDRFSAILSTSSNSSGDQRSSTPLSRSGSGRSSKHGQALPSQTNSDRQLSMASPDDGSLPSTASSNPSISTSGGDDSSSVRHIPIYPPNASSDEASKASFTLAAARLTVQNGHLHRLPPVPDSGDSQPQRRSLDSDRSFPATVSVHSIRSIGSGGSGGSSGGPASQGYLGLGMWTGSVGAGANTSLPSTSNKQPRTRFTAASLGRKSSRAASAGVSGTYSNSSGGGGGGPLSGRKSLSDFFDRAHFLESLGQSNDSKPSQPRTSAIGRASISAGRPSLAMLFGYNKDTPDEQDTIMNPFHLDEAYYQAQEHPLRTQHPSEPELQVYPGRSSHPPSSSTKSATALNRPKHKDARAREEEMRHALHAVLPGDPGRRRSGSTPRSGEAVDPEAVHVGGSQPPSDSKTGRLTGPSKPTGSHGWGSLRKRASKLIG